MYIDMLFLCYIKDIFHKIGKPMVLLSAGYDMHTNLPHSPHKRKMRESEEEQ